MHFGVVGPAWLRLTFGEAMMTMLTSTKARLQRVWNCLKSQVRSTNSDDRARESGESATILQLRANFERREGIYIEKGALRVRVYNIRGSAAERTVSLTVEEFPSPGLGVGLFDPALRKESGRLRFNIGAGYLTAFSDHSWVMGYGGWSLYFDPKVVGAVLDLASRLPHDMDTFTRYNAISRLIFSRRFAPENWQRAFPDI